MARVAFWGGLAIATALSVAPAGAAEWHKLIVTPDKFSVEFSGDVSVEPTELDDKAREALVRSTMYMQDNGNSAFVAAATLVKAAPDFQGGVDATMATYKCAKTDSDETKTLADGATNRVVRASQCGEGKSTIVGSFYVRGQWFYQVIYLVGAGADASDGERFLKSFALLAP